MSWKRGCRVAVRVFAVSVLLFSLWPLIWAVPKLHYNEDTGIVAWFLLLFFGMIDAVVATLLVCLREPKRIGVSAEDERKYLEPFD